MIKGDKKRLWTAQELIGKEMSFLDLDNKMCENGFYSLYEEGTEENCLDDGNAVFTSSETGEYEIQIFFDVLRDEGASCFRIKINDVCKF